MYKLRTSYTIKNAKLCDKFQDYIYVDYLCIVYDCTNLFHVDNI